MFRTVIFVFGVWPAIPSGAAELCSEWDKKIEPDMQIQEAAFTLDAYAKALDRLVELGSAPSTELSGFAEENALKIVKGWLLKKAAIESLGIAANPNSSKELVAFCEFLVNEAFYNE